MKHINKYLLLLFLSFSTTIFAQNWSDPVTIYTGGYNEDPAFAIDKNGVFHCVWSHKLATNFFKIYYSKSYDKGETWTEAEDISMNESLWMHYPKIVIDSNNYLYVAYGHNVGGASLIVMKTYNNISWSEADTISENMYYSTFSQIFLDNYGKLYCFWIIYPQKFYYRILENGNWGTIFQYPFLNNDKLFMYNLKVDSKNNFHCAGVHAFAGQTSDIFDKDVYFCYIDSISQWSNYVELSDNYSKGDHDIALDTLGLPTTAWGQYIDDSLPPNRGTKTSYFNGEEWSDPVLLTSNANAKGEQAIIIDRFNKKYIVNNEITNNIKKQVCYYYQDSINGWQCEVLRQNNYGFYNHKFIEYENNIYLLYIKCDTVIGSNSFTTVKVIKYKTFNCESPTIVQAEVEKNSIYVTWGQPIDTTGLTCYKVFYSNQEEPIAIVDKNTTHFSDTALSIGTYCYQVAAVFLNACTAKAEDIACGEIIEPPEIVSGMVTDSISGLPIAQVTVVFGAGYFASTNANGYYSIELPSGTYENIAFTVENYYDKIINSFVVANENNTLNVSLRPLMGIVSGMVTDNVDQTPIANANIYFTDESMATTDITGGYSIELPVGTYENIMFSAENYFEEMVTFFEVEVGENILDMALSPINSIGELENSIKIYPNPADKSIIIEGTEVSAITIFNTIGQKLEKITGKNSVDISKYQQGIYILEIIDIENNSYKTKIIIKK